MSSLRLALKQSLKEAARDGKFPLPRDSSEDDEEEEWGEETKTSSSPNEATGGASSTLSEATHGDSNTGAPRRKRGRPRKNPPPAGECQNSASTAGGASSSTSPRLRHPEHVNDDLFSSENEFSAREADERDRRLHHDEESSMESSSLGLPERKKDSQSAAANTIQNKWKQRTKQRSPPAQDLRSVTADSTDVPQQSAKSETSAAFLIQPAPSVTNANAASAAANQSSKQEAETAPTTTRVRASPSPPSPSSQRVVEGTNATAGPEDGKQKPKGTTKPKTVPPPSAELLDFQATQLPVKRARRSVTTGLRVKVRFALKKEGKKKKKWFGGKVTAVSKEGSKVRIKYDDGTTEVTKFPDKDIVVDEVANGQHQANADKFIPPSLLLLQSQHTQPIAQPPRKDDDTVMAAAASQSNHTQHGLDREHSQKFNHVSTQGKEETAHSTKKAERRKTPSPPQPQSVGGGHELTDKATATTTTASEPVEQRTQKGGPLAAAAPGSSLDADSADSNAPEKPIRKPVAEKKKSDSSFSASGASTTNVNTASSTANAQDTFSDAKVVKRKRGRPPKPRPTDTKKLDDPSKPFPKKKEEAVPPTNNDELQPARTPLTIRIPLVKNEAGTTPLSPKPSEPPQQQQHIKKKRPAVEPSDEEPVPKRIHIQKAVVLEAAAAKSEIPVASFTSPNNSPRHKKKKRKFFEEDLPMAPNLGSEHSAFEQVADEEATPRPRSKQTDNVPRSGRRAAQQANERMSNDPKLMKKKKQTDIEDDSQWVQCDGCGKWRIIPSSVVASLPKQWYCADNIYDPKRASCDAMEQTAKQVAKERKRMKRRQQRLLLEAAEGGAETSGDKSVPVVNSQPEEPVAAVKPVVKRSVSPVPAPTATAQPDRKSSVMSAKKLVPPATTGTMPPPLPEVRRGRGRPRRTTNAGNGSNDVHASQSDEADNLEWVQCEKCDKWRKLPPHISADDLPDVWYCSMNTWSTTLTCEDPEDKADGLQDVGLFGASGGGSKLSYRNLIFGSTGRKANRPVSERTRAAESLFGTFTEDEDAPPAVMYSNRSAFVSRAKTAAPQENVGPSFLEMMSHSNLWAQLRAGQLGEAVPAGEESSASTSETTDPANVMLCRPAFLSAYTYDNLPSELQEPMKELLLNVLSGEERTARSGEEVLLEAKQTNGENSLSPACMKARSYCTINVVVTALCQLVKEGLVECVRGKGSTTWTVTDWTPRFRIARKPHNTTRDSSRCMKIAKPWKRMRIIQ